MKLYLSVIGGAMGVIALGNILFDVVSWYAAILCVIWCTALQFVFDGTIAIVINKMPMHWFDVDKPFYKVSKKETMVYKKLNVRRWKDKVWELGGIGGFSKKKLVAPRDPAYIRRFIIECNKGVLTHRLSYPIGFLAMLTLHGPTAFTIALPVALVNVFLNILPTLALRYNTPMLQSHLKRLERHKSFIEKAQDPS